jgi:hypothetical protein
LAEVKIGIQMAWNATKVFQRVHFGVGCDARILLQRLSLNGMVNKNLALEIGVRAEEGLPMSI